MSTPLFEQTGETEMLLSADEDEEVVKWLRRRSGQVVETVLPVKAAKEDFVVEPEDETELEDDTNVPLWRAFFKKLRFSECLYSDMSYICRRKTNSSKKDAFFKELKKASTLAGLDTCGGGLMFLMSFIFCTG